MKDSGQMEKCSVLREKGAVRCFFYAFVLDYARKLHARLPAFGQLPEPLPLWVKAWRKTRAKFIFLV